MDRCAKLYEKIKSGFADAILITDRNNIYYFSGFSGSSGYLVITAEDKILVTDFRYTEQASYQAKGFDVYDCAAFEKEKFFSAFSKVAFENQTISYALYQTFASFVNELVPLGNLLTDIRAVKGNEEIACIEKAASIADKAFEHIIDYITPGMTERQVAFELEMYMINSGADGLSFDAIVASGARGSLPHAEPGDNILKEGDLVVMDYGCRVNGYCSDMTRTIAVGDITDAHIRAYELVKNVQLVCLDMVMPGACCSEIHNYSSKVINDAYPGCYGHGLGHGVGLEIHESPNLNTRNNGILVPGNIITVEPGVYIPGFCGVRIEDLVLVTEFGYRILSKSTKELVKI